MQTKSPWVAVLYEFCYSAHFCRVACEDVFVLELADIRLLSAVNDLRTLLRRDADITCGLPWLAAVFEVCRLFRAIACSVSCLAEAVHAVDFTPREQMDMTDDQRC